MVPALLAIAGLVLALVAAETLGGALDTAGATAGKADPSARCPVAAPTTADSVDPLDAGQARDAAPASAIAPSVKTFDRSAFTPVEPSLRETDGSSQLDITGSLGAGTLATTPAGGFELDDALCMVPKQTTADETNATIVNGDSALRANTAPDTDTIVRPTASGVAVVESLRGEQAPDSFGWKLGLRPGDRLRKLSDGGVAIVDPSHEAPATRSTPDEPATVERPEALPDAAAQLAESRYEIALAEQETGHRVVGVVTPPYAVDSNGSSEAAPMRRSGARSLTVSASPGADAVVLTVATKRRKRHKRKPTPPLPANAYPLLTIPENLHVEAANAACSFAQSQPHGRRLMLLNFGQAHVEAGAFGAGRRPFYSNDDILTALEAAATSYRDDTCHVPGTKATIAYGTGNYKLSSTGNDFLPLTPQLAQEVGAAQLETAQRLRQSVNPKDDAAVAGDIEPGYDQSPAGVDVGKSLVRGASGGDLTYYNFGTAGHCPPYTGADPGCGSWRKKDLGDVSQKRSAVPLPEIYHEYQAEQWARVRKKWDGHRARKCSREWIEEKCYSFAGATSEPIACGADLSPTQSWKKLWKANPVGSVGEELVFYNPNQFSC